MIHCPEQVEKIMDVLNIAQIVVQVALVIVLVRLIVILKDKRKD